MRRVFHNFTQRIRFLFVFALFHAEIGEQKEYYILSVAYQVRNTVLSISIDVATGLRSYAQTLKIIVETLEGRDP